MIFNFVFEVLWLETKRFFDAGCSKEERGPYSEKYGALNMILF